MKNDFLNGKRQREKEESFEAIEKDMIGQESYKGKKPKLEEKQSDNSQMASPQLNQLNLLNNENNLESKDISELVFNYNSTKINIKCKICSKDITNNIKFYCNTCTDFIFCINCFLFSDHPKSHNYHIIDNLKFPFYTDDWTVNEEHKLISNISKCGLNNWEEVSKSMNNKGQLECESHYYSFYNLNKEDPHPDENKIIIDENKNIKENQLLANKKLNNEMIKFYSSNPGNSTVEDEKENQNIKRNSRSLCVRKNSRGGGAESVSEILGVKPKRKEFDNEFLNDCEIELSHLEFNENESEKDLNIKMDILKDYNLILKEREKRKNFIFEKGMLDLRRQNRIESKLSKEEYDLLLFMRPFHRFYENSEFFDQLESVIIEQQLKLMLKTITKLENEKNSKGGKISTLEDIEKYFETEKNSNKGRKHNTHEHNKEKDKDKDNNYEENLLGSRIERYFEFNKIKKEKKMEEIFDEDEFKLVKEMPLARSTFFNIKIRIKEIVTNFEEKHEKGENLKEKIEKLIERYCLERQTHMEIFDFYCKKYNDIITLNEIELRKEKGYKKINKDIQISNIDDAEEIKSESIKSNKNRYKHKKIREKKRIKNKVIEIKDDNEIENEKVKEKESKNEKEKEKILENSIKKDNGDNKMDIEEQIKENNLENKTTEKIKKEKLNEDIKYHEKEKEGKKNKEEVNEEIKNKEREKKEINKNDNNNNNNDDQHNNKNQIDKDNNNIDVDENEKNQNKEINIEKTDIKYYKND